MKKFYIYFIAFFMLSITSLSAQNTDGTDFWLTFGKNWRDGSANVVPRIRIVTKDYPLTHVEIEFTELPASSPYKKKTQDIPARTPWEYAIDNTNDPTGVQKAACYVTTSGTDTYTINYKTIKITSDHPITVYALNQCTMSADATNLLPEPTLGKEYYQISYKCNDYKDAYGVIATQNGITEVKHNNVVVATLNKGQVYYRTSTTDMTGDHITSDKDVAFFNLNQGTHIVNSQSHDILFQQLAPVNTWGNYFLVPVSNVTGNTNSVTKEDRVRIVASEDGTEVTQIGGTLKNNSPTGVTVSGNKYTMNKGKWVELSVAYGSTGCYIEATKRVGVCTFLMTITTNSSSVQPSDAAMAWLPSMEQTAKLALLMPFAPPSGTTNLTNHRALILAPTASVDKTKVTIGTGTPTGLPSSGWKDNGDAKMSFYDYTMSNTSASYRFNNPDGVIVMGYGFGSAESYYYLGYSSMLKLDAYFTGSDTKSTVHYQNFPEELFCDKTIEFKAEFEEPEGVFKLDWYIDNVKKSPADPFQWTYTFPAGSAGPHQVKMEVEFTTGDIEPFEETLNIGANVAVTPKPMDESGGTVTPADTCIKVGEPLTLTAIPKTDHVFLGWTNAKGDTISKLETFTFTVSKDSVIVGNFKLNNFTINVSSENINYGTVEGGGDYQADEEITVTATPAPCYKFLHWKEADTIVQGAGASYTFVVKKDRTLIACFEKLRYDITVESNPATGFTVYSSKLKDFCGEPITVTSTSDPCYTFKGWKDKFGTVVSTALSFTFTLKCDTILTATFERNINTVTLHSDPIKGSVTGDGDYICGDPVTITASPEDCYSFLKWTNANGDSISGANPFNFNISKDTVLYAIFKYNTYYVTVTADPAVGNNTVSANGGNPGCDNTIALFAFPDDCYEFVKWETLGGDSVTNANPYFFTIKKDSTLVAKFKIKTYNVNIALTVNPSASGTATGGGSIFCGDEATVTALADSCHTFVKWTNFLTGDSISGANPYTFVVTGNRDFVANFKRITYDIKVSASHPVGNNTVKIINKDIRCGTKNNIEATVDECYNFVNWTLGGVPVSTNLKHTFFLNGDSTYVANYAIKQYNVSVQTNTPTVTGNVVTDNYTNVNCGDTRDFTATADPCYTFVNWTDQHGTEVSKNRNFTLTVKSDSVLTANFTIKKYSVTVGKTPIACDGTVAITKGLSTDNDCGDEITVTATNSHCFFFVHWVEKGSGTVVSGNPAFTFNIGANRDLVAVFTQKTFNLSVQKNTPTNNQVTGGKTNAPCGEFATIVAIPDIFHTFFHWTDLAHNVISTNNVEQIDVRSDTSLIAVFIPKTYNITVNSSSTAGGTVTGGGTDVPYNTSMTIEASCNPPIYKFSHWEDYGTKVEGAGPVYTFPVTGDRNLVAVFAKETVIIKVIAEPDTGGMAYQSAYKVELDSLCYVWATPSFCNHFTHWSLLDGPTLSVQDTFTFQVYPGPTSPLPDLTSYIEDGVITFVAHFMPNTYHIDVEPFPYPGGNVYINGILGGGDGDFTCDTEIEIKAVANHPKYKFVKWVEVIGTDSTWVSNDSIYTFVVRADRKLVALFELEKYQITLIPNPGGCGTVKGGGLFPYDTKITVQAEEFDECTFYNWTENGVPLGSNPNFNFTVTRDRTLYANFIPKTYTVKVKESPPGIGGTVTGNYTNVAYGEIKDIKATPLHPYVFSHWEEDGIPYSSWPANHQIVVTKDFDLTAVFVLKEYEITLESDPATGGTTIGEGTFVHGTVINVEAFAAECHTFSHWSDNGLMVGSLPVFNFTVTGPRHLVAHFIPVMYEITVSAEPLAGGIPTGGGSKACLSEVTLLANPDDCYEFTGWFEVDTLISNEPEYTFIVKGARDFVAHYEQKLFNITTSVDPVVAPPGSGYIVVTGGNETDILCGEDRDIEAFAEIGYLFTHWTINGVDEFANPHTINVTEDFDIVAHFEPREYDIVLYAAPHYGGQAKTSNTYPHGLMLTVHAIPNPEYVFREWTEFDIPIPGAAANYTFKVEGPRILTAHFDTATFTVTTSALPLNGGFTYGDSTNIPYGSSITVTAVPNDCFIFDYWSIDGVWKSYDTVYTFIVKQNCHLVAHFKKETYNIILKTNPPLGGWAEVVGGNGYNVPCGDSITIKATPFSNYEFYNWTDKTGAEFSPSPTHKFSVTQHDTLTANFVLKKYDVFLSVAPGGDGTVCCNSYGVTHGDSVEIHATPNPGYKFLYWKEFGQTDVFSNKADIVNMPVHKSMHLVAYFEPETFRIQLKTNPGDYAGTVWGVPDGEYFPFGTYFIANALENQPFFSWDRWTDEDNNTIDLNKSFGFNVIESRTLIAHFTTVSFEIEVSAEPEEGGTVEGGGEYDYGLTIPLTATPNVPCFAFAGWYENDEWVTDENPFMFTVDGPHHFVAHFEQKTFNINTSVFGDGYIEIFGGDTLDIACDEERIIKATANTGYVFDYWLINGVPETANPHTIVVKEDLDIEAHFLFVEFTITLEPNPVLYGTASPMYGVYPHNTELTVHATPKPGFMFIEWMEEDTVIAGANADYTFNVLKSRHLVAMFDSARYRVTTMPSPGDYAGTTTPADTSGLAYQALLKVTAVAKENYTFKHWMENDIPIPGQPDYTFPVTKNRDLVAVFEPKKYNITLGKKPSGGGEVGGGGNNLPYNSIVQIRAKANPNYDFYHWENEDEIPIYTNDTTYHTVLKTERLTAVFIPKKYDIIVTPAPMGWGQAWDSHYGVPYNDVVTIYAQAEEGYVFDGWYENDSLLHKITPWTLTVTGTRELEARFVKEKYNIVLKANPNKGGTVSGGGYDFNYVDVILIKAEPTDQCYSFNNWTDEKGTVIASTPTHYLTVTKSDTITANFTAITGKISLFATPVGAGVLTADGIVGGGNIPRCETITILAEEDGCYTFDYWTEMDTIVAETPSFEITVGENNRTFVAHFTQKRIDVSVRANPEEGGTVSGSANSILCGESITLTAIPNDGYHFVNWTLNDEILSSDEVFLYKTTETGEVVANFELNKYTITVAENPSGFGIVSGGGNYDYGTEIEVRATPKTGYLFVDWTEGGEWVSDDTTFTFMVDRDRELVANFIMATFTITTEANPTEGGTTIGDDTDIPYGETRTVKAFVNENFTFVNWTEDGIPIQGADTVYTFTVTKDRELVANFKSTKNYNILLTKEPDYGGRVEGGGYNLPFGTDTAAIAHPGKNYNFAGWFENDSCVSFDTIYKITVKGNRWLVAKFVPKNYDIRVFAAPMDGGKATGGGFGIVYGEETTVIAEPYNGYVFKYWLEAGFTEPADYRAEWTFPVTRSKDLTAVFEPAVLTVTLLAEPAEGGVLYGGGTDFAYGDEVTIRAAANRFYFFEKWTDEEGETVSLDSAYTFRIEKSRTFTAHFTAITSKITLIANPDSGGILTGDGDIVQGKLHRITASPIIGYNFVSWTEGGVFITADTLYEFTVDERDRTFTANFEYKAFNINVSAQPTVGGTASGGGEFPQRTHITVIAQPDECYRFINWTEGGVPVSTEKEYAFIVNKDRNLVANFVRNNFSVTVAASPPEYGTATGNALNIPCKQEITVTATPNIGYKFENWTKNGTVVSYDSVYRFPVMETCELIANFAENINTITLYASPENMGSVTGGGNYLYGAPATIKATSKSGFSFVNWTENGKEVSKLAIYTFTVTTSRILVANFDTTYYNVTVLSNDTLYGTAAGSGKFKENEIVRIVASVKQGYRFLNWTINDTILSNSSVFDYTVTKNVTIVANFYGMDFDTYAATLWDNTFMLDLKKLENEGYEIIRCKWFKNYKEEVHTHTINEFSYSAGPKITDRLELDPNFYYFQLTTANGSVLYSTKKILPYHQFSKMPTNDNLFIYPNPAASGTSFTVENAIAGALLQVYNQFGVCVKTITAADTTLTLSLNLPAGIYLIRNENKEAKVIITK